jgi:hypothetical protein
VSADDKQEFWRRAPITEEQAKDPLTVDRAWKALERQLLWDIWEAGYYTSFIQRDPISQHDPRLVATALGLRRFDAGR